MLFQKKILFTKKEYLKEFIEDCLHKRENEWDLVAVEDNVNNHQTIGKLADEICHRELSNRDTFAG